MSKRKIVLLTKSSLWA